MRARRAHLEAIVVEVDRAFDLDVAWIAAGIECAAMDDIEVGSQLHLVERGVVGEPPVGETARSFERDRRLATEPERYRALHR